MTKSSSMQYYKQLIYCVIGFGLVTAYGDVKYSLPFVDKASCMSNVQPSKTLNGVPINAVF